IFEIFVGEEQLLAGRPDEGVAAVHAVQRLVLELHRYLSHSPLLSRHRGGMPAPDVASRAPAPAAIDFAALLLARAFTRERLLGAAAIPGLQVEGMLLDILDDIFLLHLPLGPAKRALDGLAILHFHFSQALLHPPCGRRLRGRTVRP